MTVERDSTGFDAPAPLGHPARAGLPEGHPTRAGLIRERRELRRDLVFLRDARWRYRL